MADQQRHDPTQREQHRAAALDRGQQARAHHPSPPAIPFAEPQQQTGGRDDNAALKTAAGGRRRVQHDVQPEQQDQGPEQTNGQNDGIAYCLCRAPGNLAGTCAERLTATAAQQHDGARNRA